MRLLPLSSAAIVRYIPVVCGCLGLLCSLFGATVSLTNYNRSISLELVPIPIYGLVLFGGVILAAIGCLLSVVVLPKGNVCSSLLLLLQRLSLSVNMAALLTYALWLIVIPVLLSGYR